MYFSVSFPWSILFVFPGSKVYCRNVESSIEKRYSYLKTYLLHTCVLRCSQLALMKSNILQRSNKLDFPLLVMVFNRKLHSLCPMVFTAYFEHLFLVYLNGRLPEGRKWLSHQGFCLTSPNKTNAPTLLGWVNLVSIGESARLAPSSSFYVVTSAIPGLQKFQNWG